MNSEAQRLAEEIAQKAEEFADLCILARNKHAPICIAARSGMQASIEALAALHADQARDARWQPIETAPRGSGLDGPAMTTHPDYVAPPRLLLSTSEGIAVGYYDWYYHPGYGAGAEPGVSAWRTLPDYGETYSPTHWMPLPDAPDAAMATKEAR